MSVFVGREKELAKLRSLAAEAGARFLIFYGPRLVDRQVLSILNVNMEKIDESTYIEY